MRSTISLLLVIASCIAVASFVKFNQRTLSATNDVLLHVVEAFDSWKVEHARVYRTPMEKAYRLALFYKNWLKVNTHNQQNRSYRLGINLFSDMTLEEVKAKHFGLQKSDNANIEVDYTLLNRGEPSNDIDWKDKGAVTPVKNQKSCGSCWAFSATGALEGLDFIHNKLKTVNSYSEQQLVDCSRSYGNEGCNGGDMYLAFKYVRDHGITTEDKYPYVAKDQKCQTKVGSFVISSYKKVPAKSSGSLAHACDSQPVSVSIDADGILSYKDGVFDDKSCGTNLNHGVLLTGYDSEVWKVKNSWSTTWGEDGYIRFSRSAVPETKGGICGILLDNTYPTLN